MLFPMEVLFERYVEVLLRRQLLAGSKLRAQLSGQDLCLHQERGMFRLKPDLLLDLAGQNWVLDTKWKLLDAGAVSDKYGLSQADFYQMFAYGQKYLAGSGDMLLIYPCTERFQKPLPLFEFSPELRLQVVPFDLESGILCLDGLITLPLASGGH